MLAKLITGVANSIDDPTLASTVQQSIDTAVRQRTTVGLTGLAIALYSGVNWVGNLRQAILAQSRPIWERNKEDQEKFTFVIFAIFSPYRFTCCTCYHYYTNLRCWLRTKIDCAYIRFRWY